MGFVYDENYYKNTRAFYSGKPLGNRYAPEDPEFIPEQEPPKLTGNDPNPLWYWWDFFEWMEKQGPVLGEIIKNMNTVSNWFDTQYEDYYAGLLLDLQNAKKTGASPASIAKKQACVKEFSNKEKYMAKTYMSILSAEVSKAWAFWSDTSSTYYPIAKSNTGQLDWGVHQKVYNQSSQTCDLVGR